jgi:hypothetical protein
MRELERGKREARRAHFPREIGHKSQESFMRESVVTCCC